MAHFSDLNMDVHIPLLSPIYTVTKNAVMCDWAHALSLNLSYKNMNQQTMESTAD